MKKNKTPDELYEDAQLKIAVYQSIEKIGTMFEDTNQFESAHGSANPKHIEKLLFRDQRQRKVRRTIVLAAVIAALISIACTAYALRGLLFHTHDSYTSIHQGKSSSDLELYARWEDACFPSYIPKGYILTRSCQYDQTRCAEFTKVDDLITVNVMPMDVAGSIDTELANFDTCVINGSEALIASKDNRTLLVWDYEEWTILLTGANRDSLIKIAESIK